MSLDPLAEKYYNISPYVYCANNPVNLVDRDGKQPRPSRPSSRNNRYYINNHRQAPITPHITRNTYVYKQANPTNPRPQYIELYTTANQQSQMSTGNKNGQKLSLAINLADAVVEMKKTVNWNEKTGITIDESYNISFTNPESQANFNAATKEYNENVLRIEKEQGLHDTPLEKGIKKMTNTESQPKNIGLSIMLELGPSPAQQILNHYNLDPKKYKLINTTTNSIPSISSAN